MLVGLGLDYYSMVISSKYIHVAVPSRGKPSGTAPGFIATNLTNRAEVSKFPQSGFSIVAFFA
jgi:hypothetical protein